MFVVAGTPGATDSAGAAGDSRPGSVGCTTIGGDGSGVCSTPIGALKWGSVTAGANSTELLGGAVSLTGGAGMPVEGAGTVSGAASGAAARGGPAGADGATIGSAGGARLGSTAPLGEAVGAALTAGGAVTDWLATTGFGGVADVVTGR